MSKYYVCWKKNRFVDCTIFCMDLNEAKRYAKEKEKEGGKTLIEYCVTRHRKFYDHIAAVIEASDKL